MQKIIAVTGYKGGVGKTVTAVHLAGCIALTENRPRVLLIDGDDNRSAKAWWLRSKDPRRSFPFDVATHKESIRKIKDYEIIIIDTAANPERDDVQELASSSDLIILPTKPDGLSLHPTLKAVNSLPLQTNYQILVCAAPAHPAKDAVELKLELEKSNYQVFKSNIRYTKGFGMAAEQGVLIKDLKHFSKVAWYDYISLTKEISIFA